MRRTPRLRRSSLAQGRHFSERYFHQAALSSDWASPTLAGLAPETPGALGLAGPAAPSTDPGNGEAGSAEESASFSASTSFDSSAGTSGGSTKIGLWTFSHQSSASSSLGALKAMHSHSSSVGTSLIHSMRS